MKKVDTNILGCKVNHADVQAILAGLNLPADLPVGLVGTCCVTAEADKQSRKEVRRSIRRLGPGGRVFVTGCAARRDPASFSGMGGNVLALAGLAEDAAREINAELRKSHSGQTDEDPGSSNTHPAMPVMTGPGGKVKITGPKENGRTRFFLKVQDGCSQGCAYCVIPLVRGRPRSFPLHQVLRRAEEAVTAGYPELVVTGINVGAWRDGDARLPQLMDRLAGTSGLKRLRLSSVEAGSVTRELLDVFRRHPVVGNHLHIPLQSGDDGVLRSMGRRHGRAGFSRAVDAARNEIPGINITTDVIVGFPSEDEASFGNTLSFVKAAGFSKVHVFAYSARPGTKAADMGDPIPAAEKKLRSRLLRELSRSLQEKHRRRKLGRLSEVLLESAGAHGKYRGYSCDYTRFLVEGGREGALVKVRAVAVNDEGVMGSVV
ncbi:MAG: MiaB/RimO family radical SAM methylthiotransferase [Thermoleophilia bacterium]|nr:MiaB/RimO family radical SAM methylthiotransferase [Thermoleophilia bacterium]